MTDANDTNRRRWRWPKKKQQSWIEQCKKPVAAAFNSPDCARHADGEWDTPARVVFGLGKALRLEIELLKAAGSLSLNTCNYSRPLLRDKSASPVNFRAVFKAKLHGAMPLRDRRMFNRFMNLHPDHAPPMAVQYHRTRPDSLSHWPLRGDPIDKNASKMAFPIKPRTDERIQSRLRKSDIPADPMFTAHVASSS